MINLFWKLIVLSILQNNSTILKKKTIALFLGNGNVILENGNAVLENGNAILENGNAILENGNAILESDSAISENDNATASLETIDLFCKISTGYIEK